MPSTAIISDTTGLQNLAKIIYPQKEIEKLCYLKQPFFANVAKATDFFGKAQQVALRYSTTNGRSSTFTTAVNNQSSSKIASWLVTRAKDYSIASIDSETIRALSNDKGAIVEGLKTELEAAMDALKRSIGISLFGDGTGRIGTIASVSATPGVITLSNANDITNFEVGMILQAVNAGTAGPASPLLVTAVNRTLGTVTVSGSDSTYFVANNIIVQAGDYSAKMTGLAGWLPAADPTNTPFFGLDRSVDPVRLGGVRLFGSASTVGLGIPIEEALQRLATRIAREGGAPEVAYVNHEDWIQLSLAMGTRIMLEPGGEGKLGFGALKIVGPAGPVTVYADPNCPQGRGYMLTPSTWKLWSCKEMPGYLDDDGLTMLRNASEDSYQVRIGYYANLVCVAPGFNGTVLF